MTEALEAAAAEVVGSLNELDAIGDPVERYQASKQAEVTFKEMAVAFDAKLRAARQSIALELKHQHSKTWREIGEVMGDVTAQRAEQISRGV